MPDGDFTQRSKGQNRFRPLNLQAQRKPANASERQRMTGNNSRKRFLLLAHGSLRRWTRGYGMTSLEKVQGWALAVACSPFPWRSLSFVNS
jgi:hypothetical protein